LKILVMMSCVPFLAGASCTTSNAYIQPCDVLVFIPNAPPHVNKILLSDALDTAKGIAKHKTRYKDNKCGTQNEKG